MKRIAGLLLLLLGSPLPAAPGSWQSPLDELRLAVAGRFYHSEPATPPPMAAGADIVLVGWRYRLPAGRRVQAWLCQGEQCLPLGSARRGQLLAPPAWRIERPLRLRFRLPAGDRRAVTVGTPRLTVEYR